VSDSKDVRQYPRFLQIFMGAALGFAWGTILWAITGQKGGWNGWAYIALTCAMLGCGVAAFFGAATVRRQGERVTPRVPRFGRRR
jgi:hypothetical protein